MLVGFKSIGSAAHSVASRPGAALSRRADSTALTCPGAGVMNAHSRTQNPQRNQAASFGQGFGCTRIDFPQIMAWNRNASDCLAPGRDRPERRIGQHRVLLDGVSGMLINGRSDS